MGKPIDVLGVFRKLWRRVRRFAPIYWLRTHIINRYHIIDIRGQGDYTWGWIDRDQAMFLACFKLLVDFCEGELVHARTSYLDDDAWADAHGELLFLYDWWKRGRAEEHAECMRLFEAVPRTEWKDLPNGYSELLPNRDPVAQAAWLKCEHALDEKDEAMFQRLIKARHFMWT